MPKVQTWGNSITELRSPKAKVRLEGRIKISIVAGAIGFLTLVMLVCQEFSSTPLRLLCLGASTLHFVFMETDYKGNLNVRPFGLLPLPLVAIALLALMQTIVV